MDILLYGNLWPYLNMFRLYGALAKVLAFVLRGGWWQMMVSFNNSITELFTTLYEKQMYSVMGAHITVGCKLKDKGKSIVRRRKKKLIMNHEEMVHVKRQTCVVFYLYIQKLQCVGEKVNELIEQHKSLYSLMFL